tara:strand:- start:978 stop:1136 length:159 start_codon:yes stop_codon:yes gene_type:complete
MKSEKILYDRHFERGETSKGHYVDIARNKIMNAIIDLAEDVKELNKMIKEMR